MLTGCSALLDNTNGGTCTRATTGGLGDGTVSVSNVGYRLLSFTTNASTVVGLTGLSLYFASSANCSVVVQLQAAGSAGRPAGPVIASQTFAFSPSTTGFASLALTDASFQGAVLAPDSAYALIIQGTSADAVLFAMCSGNPAPSAAVGFTFINSLVANDGAASQYSW